MKRYMSLMSLVLALAVATSPVPLLAQAQALGSISGTAVVDGAPLANVTVQLRSVADGQLVGSLTSNAQGAFSFTGLNPGAFVVEIVGPQGAMLGTSSAVTLTAGAMTATGVTVATTAAAVAAAGIGVGAAAAVGGGFFTSTIGIVTLAAAGAGITAGVIATQDDASPSQ